MHVTANTDRCCGAGQCVLLAPDVFDQDEDTGIVELLDDAPPADRHGMAREAAAVCPAAAIAVDDRP